MNGKTEHSDIVADILDQSRFWQVKNIILIYLLKIPTAFFMACIVYTAPVPYRTDVYCSDDLGNVTLITFPVIVDRNDQEFDLPFCDAKTDVTQKFVNYFGLGHNSSSLWHEAESDSDLDLLPCTLLTARDKFHTQFDIYCSRGALIVLTQGMHLVGIFLSGVVVRYATRVYSPKIVMQCAMMTQIICGSFAGVVQWLSLHLMLRCMAAIGCAAAFGAGAMIISDITRGKLKVVSLILFDTFWSVGILILSIITQFEARWMQLYFIISWPTIFLLIIYSTVTDSPTWFLRRNMSDKVVVILTEAAESYNSTAEIPKDLKWLLDLKITELKSSPPPKRFVTLWNASIRDTFKYISFYVAWSCFTINYFGMMLNMRNYGKFNLPRNAQLLAGFELFGCFFASLISVYSKKHKWMLSGMFNIIGGLCALNIWWFRAAEEEFVNDGTLLLFALLLKASVSSSFGILCSSAAEVGGEGQQDILAFSGPLCGRLFLHIAPVIVAIGTPLGEYVTLSLFSALGMTGGLAMISIRYLV